MGIIVVGTMARSVFISETISRSVFVSVMMPRYIFVLGVAVTPSLERKYTCLFLYFRFGDGVIQRSR